MREALTVEVFLALNETFRALEAHARRGLADPPSFRDALDEHPQGALHRRRRHRAHVHPRRGLALPQAGRVAGAHLPHRAGPARQAARPGRRRAAGRRRRSTTPSGGRCCAALRLAGELPALVRRPPGAGAGRAASCCSTPTRRARCATGSRRSRTSLERIAGGGEPTAAMRLGRAAARRPLLPGRAAGRDAAPTPRSSTGSWTPWPRPTTRSPRSTSSPDHAARHRAPLRVRLRRLHQRVVHGAARASQDDGRPDRQLLRPGGGAADPRPPLPRLERQRHPPLHDHALPRPDRGGQPLAGRAPIRPRRRSASITDRGAGRRSALSAAGFPRPRRAGAGSRRRSAPPTRPPAPRKGAALGEHVLALGPSPGQALRVPQGRDRVRLDDRGLSQDPAPGSARTSPT